MRHCLSGVALLHEYPVRRTGARHIFSRASSLGLVLCLLLLLECPAVVSLPTAAADDSSAKTVVLASADVVDSSGSPSIPMFATLTGNRVLTDRPEMYGPTNFTLESAFPVGLLSEIFVSTVAVHMSLENILPFALDGVIPVAYLPPVFSKMSFLANPATSEMPISMRDLLQHLSTLSEVGFESATRYASVEMWTSTTEALVPTLEVYVEDLFSTYFESEELWMEGRSAGTANAFFFSRNNIALATYILNKVLADSDNASQTPDVVAYLANIILPPLGIVDDVFFLDRKGQKPAPSYPTSLQTSNFNALQYVTVQEIWANATVCATIPIHPVYTADFMLYATGNALNTFLTALLNMYTPGLYYYRIGTTLLSNVISVTPSIASFPLPMQQKQQAIVRRSIGFFGVDLYTLCQQTYLNCIRVQALSVAFGAIAPNRCSAFISTCTTSTGCFLSLTFTSCVSGDYDVDSASRVRMAQPQPGSDTTPSPAPSPEIEKISYLWLFVGTIGIIGATFIVSYVADHLVHPASPTQPILPEPDRGFDGLGGNETTTKHGFSHRRRHPRRGVHSDLDSASLSPSYSSMTWASSSGNSELTSSTSSSYSAYSRDHSNNNRHQSYYDLNPCVNPLPGTSGATGRTTNASGERGSSIAAGEAASPPRQLFSEYRHRLAPSRSSLGGGGEEPIQMLNLYEEKTSSS